MLVCVQITQLVRLLVVPIDAEIGRREDFAQLVADEIDDGLETQFRGERLLNGVDDRQLRGALFRFLQQPLRLIEQARVLQRHTHARGHRTEQAHSGFVVRVLALIVLHDDRA